MDPGTCNVAKDMMMMEQIHYDVGEAIITLFGLRLSQLISDGKEEIHKCATNTRRNMSKGKRSTSHQISTKCCRHLILWHRVGWFCCIWVTSLGRQSRQSSTSARHQRQDDEDYQMLCDNIQEFWLIRERQRNTDEVNSSDGHNVN